MIKKTKVIIVRISDPKLWYRNMKGKTFHIYGDIDNPFVSNGSYTCVENSSCIRVDDVILITN